MAVHLARSTCHASSFAECIMSYGAATPLAPHILSNLVPVEGIELGKLLGHVLEQHGVTEHTSVRGRQWKSVCTSVRDLLGFVQHTDGLHSLPFESKVAELAAAIQRCLPAT